MNCIDTLIYTISTNICYIQAKYIRSIVKALHFHQDNFLHTLEWPFVQGHPRVGVGFHKLNVAKIFLEYHKNILADFYVILVLTSVQKET
jgi:hypothetical protein